MVQNPILSQLNKLDNAIETKKISPEALQEELNIIFKACSDFRYRNTEKTDEEKLDEFIITHIYDVQFATLFGILEKNENLTLSVYKLDMKLKDNAQRFKEMVLDLSSTQMSQDQIYEVAHLIVKKVRDFFKKTFFRGNVLCGL